MHKFGLGERGDIFLSWREAYQEMECISMLLITQLAGIAPIRASLNAKALMDGAMSLVICNLLQPLADYYLESWRVMFWKRRRDAK